MDQQQQDSVNTDDVGSVVHYAVLFVLSFLPAAVGTELFPSEITDSKELTFIQVYLLTLPFALAVTIIVAGFLSGKIPTDNVWAVGGFIVGVLIVTQFVNLSLAPGIPTTWEINQVAHPLGKLFYVGVWIVGGYAVIYGFPLFAAAVLVGSYAGWVFHHKVTAKMIP